MRRIATLELSARWLSISLPLRQLSRPISVKVIASMSRRNARIRIGARIVGQRQQGRRQIVTDLPVDMLPWDDAAALDDLLGTTLAGLYAAVSTNPRWSASPPQAGLPREQIEAIFDEAGWPAQQGEGDHLEVPLEVPGSYFLARVDHDSAWWRLSVPLAAADLASAPLNCRNAMLVLQWLTASNSRMVKPVCSRPGLTLEVTLAPEHCSASGIAHACAALSVALQHCATEAALLVTDEALAQAYLSNLGFSTSS